MITLISGFGGLLINNDIFKNNETLHMLTVLGSTMFFFCLTKIISPTYLDCVVIEAIMVILLSPIKLKKQTWFEFIKKKIIFTFGCFSFFKILNYPLLFLFPNDNLKIIALTKENSKLSLFLFSIIKKVISYSWILPSNNQLILIYSIIFTAFSIFYINNNKILIEFIKNKKIQSWKWKDWFNLII